ncbi:MAG: hypothetical protein F2817_01170 [Actinobacteria bacterium]|nr:hypothetical protein [Actinomycetota bacterium]
MPSNTTRLGLTRPVGSDPANVPADFATLTNQLDGLMLPRSRGTFANRPDAGVEDRLYFATDRKLWYQDTGADWRLITTWTRRSATGSITALTSSSVFAWAGEGGASAQPTVAAPYAGQFDIEVSATIRSRQLAVSAGAVVSIDGTLSGAVQVEAIGRGVSSVDPLPFGSGHRSIRRTLTANQVVSLTARMLNYPETGEAGVDIADAYVQLRPVQEF